MTAAAADDWERSSFATGSELDIREALTALDRVLEHGDLGDGVRDALVRARAALHAALG